MFNLLIFNKVNFKLVFCHFYVKKSEEEEYHSNNNEFALLYNLINFCHCNNHPTKIWNTVYHKLEYKIIPSFVY